MDQEIIVGHSRIQHGKLNDRVYLMDHKVDKEQYILNQIQLLAKTYNYGKIIAKTKYEAKSIFEKNEFVEEAFIPNFYGGEKDCIFMVKYCNDQRRIVDDKAKIVNILKDLEEEQSVTNNGLNHDYYIRRLKVGDVDDMVIIFKKVFDTYPFPIHDPKFIEKTMEDETIYFGMFFGDDLIGISSCEMSMTYKNVEMTDFAIIPEHRGKGLAKHLLNKMEIEMKSIGIKTAYTIARSVSFPMNATFAGNGYLYGGTLWNNTQIAGKIESMNVWHKPLHKI